MIEWILVLTFYAGAMANSDSVAIAAVPVTFNAGAECEKAGRDAVGKLGTMKKAVNYVCLARSK